MEDDMELKKVVCEIIDMNGGDFLYSPSVHFYKDGSVIVACFITDTMTSSSTSVQGENIIANIHSATERMQQRRAEYKKDRIAYLEKELSCLK
jgi:Na+-translocating ferredoxin:NAD+ oxidoreductase RnfD subunit